MGTQMEQRAELSSSVRNNAHPLNSLSVDGALGAAAGTARCWVLRLRGGNSDVEDKTLWMAMQILMSTACRVLFIAGGNAQITVATMLKNSV